MGKFGYLLVQVNAVHFWQAGAIQHCGACVDIHGIVGELNHAIQLVLVMRR